MSLGVGTLNTNRKDEIVPGPPFAANAAENGLSVDAGGVIVLGNDSGGAAAQLNNTREIPLNGNTVDFTDNGGTSLVRIGAASIDFGASDGVVSGNSGSIGLTLFTSGQLQLGPVPSAGAPADPTIFAEVVGNTRISGWLLNQIRIDALPDAPDLTLTPEDSGGLYGMPTPGIFLPRIITLPPAVPGLFYHFSYQGNGVVPLQILPDGTDLIFFGIVLVTATAAGQGIETNVFSSITLCCIQPGWWTNIAQTGAFTAI